MNALHIDHVIYHGGCTDGHTSAWLLNRAAANDPVLHPYQYEVPPPQDLHGTVVVADFSFPVGVVAEIAGRVDRLVILDHHKTPVEELTGPIPAGVEAILDVTRSGAGITADWIEQAIGGTWRTRFVDYVENRDLWKFSLPHCRAVAVVINSAEMPAGGSRMFDAWDAIAARVNDDVEFEQVIAVGSTVCDREDVLMAQIIENAQDAVIGGYTVPAVAAPYGLGSDTCDRLCAERPEIPFAAYYIDTAVNRKWGLRGRPGGVDVEKVAKAYGGGGHATASGLRTEWESGPLAPGPRFGEFGE